MGSSHSVILFGAGASYGSDSVSPRRPPLGAGLFDELCRAYPEAWGKLPESDRSKFVPNFELGMKALWDSGSHDVTVLLRCVAHYFTQFRADHGNAYARLLEHLEYRGALDNTYFSSLNYECILETAARNFGFRTIDYAPAATPASRTLAVWKLHGSCNFLPGSISGAAASISFSASAVSWDGEARIADPIEARKFIEQSAFNPAMAVYMAGKPVNSHPALIREFQTRWAEKVGSARKVGIIGVAPNPADSHIWDPLANTQADVVAIGDRTAIQDWTGSSRAGRKTVVIGERFADSLPAFAEEFGKPSAAS